MKPPAPLAIRRFLLVALAATVALGTAGCRRSQTTGTGRSPAERKAEGREILDTLESLIHQSDQATSPVTVTLVTGETATGRVPRPHALPASREVQPPPLRDPLRESARFAARWPTYPAGFDWAPGSSSILLVADREGLWRVDVDTGNATRAMTFPPKFVPHQVISGPRNQVLLAQAGQAMVVRWGAAGPVGPPVRAPKGFRLNYATWSPSGDSVTGILEYLQFSSAMEALGEPGSPDRIHLGTTRWVPGEKDPRGYNGPPADKLAWLSGAPVIGTWVALLRNPGQIDPFPGPLRYWNSVGKGWAPVFRGGRWTDADPSFAAGRWPKNSYATPGTITVAWVRRIRPNQRVGRPCLAWVDSAPGGILGTDAVLPLSEANVARIVLSRDGRRLAFSDPPAGSPRGTGLFVAELSAADTAARKADLYERERTRRENVRAFRMALDAAWSPRKVAAHRSVEVPGGATADPADATGQNFAGIPGGAAPIGNAAPPHASKAQIQKNIDIMDRTFAAAAKKYLGVRADHSLASLADIDAGLDWLGGDFTNDPGVLAGLGAYFGETVRRAGDVEWNLSNWPPDLDTAGNNLSASDGFLYTTHRPFWTAAAALDHRVSLAATARDLLTNWPRPIHLVDDDDKPAVARIVRQSLAAAGLAPISTSSSAEPAAPSPGRIAKWIASPPKNDWVLLRILEYKGTGEHLGARWRLAAELVRRRPGYAKGFGLLGQVLAESGWPGPALAAFLRASELDPADAGYVVGAAMAAFDHGDYGRSKQLFLRARALDPGAEWKETIDEALKALADPTPTPSVNGQ